MHDVAEGSIPNIVLKFFDEAIKLGVTTLEDINSAIKDFDFGFHNHNNKPGPIDLTESLGLKASQKLVLFLHFPLIFHGMSTEQRIAPYWRGITSLVGITKICLARKISEADLESLQSLVSEHIRQITRVYDQHLKPKQHWLTHYMNIIRKMGPPLIMWTMR